MDRNAFAFKQVIFGVFLALLALLTGELHGMAFGAKEDAIKQSFKASSEAAEAALGGPEKVIKAQEDAWKYLKRAHEHFMGLGAVALGLCLFIGLSPVAPWLKTAASTSAGLGAVLYPLFWTLTAIRAAGMGGHAAKESLAIMAQAGAMFGLLGILGALIIAAQWAFTKE
ncbi:MAG: hypothetical protein HY751_13735 [Nitrospinae bacterium]|nr:hypothetical protein [Nitrospinota bacterium]